VVLSVFSWLTMAIIVGILAFMMDPGSWSRDQSFISAFFNPVYLPQLVFRTPFAMIAAGMFALFTMFFLTKRDDPARPLAIRLVSVWSLAWVPLMVAGSLWYRAVVPGWMIDNVPVALMTQAYANWYDALLTTLLVAGGIIVAVSLWGLVAPTRLPRVALVVPLVAAFLLLGSFERVREFIRKPFVIEDYMYANGIRMEDYPLLKEEGVLAHATYVSSREIRDDNRIDAGRDVFLLTCTRCHTTSGVNGILDKLRGLYGPGEWDPATVEGFIRNMHNARPYMPPFPGSDEELAAMTEYIFALRDFPTDLPGAQSVGVDVPGDRDAAEGGR
jgi:mono/diheme cytochrome c family protein